MSIYLQVSKVPAVVAALLGGVLLWQVLARSQGEVSIAFMEDIWSRNLLNVFASPLTTGEYLAGMIGFGFAKLVAATALMGGLAFAFYGFGLLSLGPSLVPFLFLLLVMAGPSASSPWPWSCASGTAPRSSPGRWRSPSSRSRPCSTRWRSCPADAGGGGVRPGQPCVRGDAGGAGRRRGGRPRPGRRGRAGPALPGRAVWFFRRMLVTARRTGGLARFAE